MPEAEGLDNHWFEPIADHLGSAYLRYSFTKGTVSEVDALVEMGGFGPGHRLLDVGCGPGRHVLELASRGIQVVGVDISSTFVEVARQAVDTAGLGHLAEFVVGDARRLGDVEGLGTNFDGVVSLCQGAFGLTGGPGSESSPNRELDESIMAGFAAALRPGGMLVLSAFSSYFQVQHLDETEAFDAETGVSHEHTVVMDEAGASQEAELWTTCYTPRELRLLARLVGLTPTAVWGVTPGRYGATPPSIECPEFLLVAQRPTGNC